VSTDPSPPQPPPEERLNAVYVLTIREARRRTGRGRRIATPQLGCWHRWLGCGGGLSVTIEEGPCAMPLQPSRTTGILGLILVGAWSGLAFGLGALLSVPLGDDHSASDVSVQRRLRTASFDVRGADPCTDEPVEVEPRLTILIVRNGEAGSTSTDVEARLENHPGTSPMDGINPLVRHLAFDSTQSGDTPYIHSLRTPLAGRHSSLELVVDLVGGIDARGNVSLSMSSAQIDLRRSHCSILPPSQQPKTHLVQYLLAN
jgi:hypothetical protein